mmetsp:Transcript_26535/g.63185  ORF Transcript_26535/g.63185 Transcript_26535/m.63185 type:complete len:261 (+) Transcript_26535:190-972(+)
MFPQTLKAYIPGLTNNLYSRCCCLLITLVVLALMLFLFVVPELFLGMPCDADTRVLIVLAQRTFHVVLGTEIPAATTVSVLSVRSVSTIVVPAVCTVLAPVTTVPPITTISVIAVSTVRSFDSTSLFTFLLRRCKRSRRIEEVQQHIECRPESWDGVTSGITNNSSICRFRFRFGSTTVITSVSTVVVTISYINTTTVVGTVIVVVVTIDGSGRCRGWCIDQHPWWKVSTSILIFIFTTAIHGRCRCDRWYNRRLVGWNI